MAVDLGDVYRLTFTLTAPSGGLVNTSAMALTITLPDGTIVSPTVTNPPATTGQYLYDYQTTQAGRHMVRWVGTGTSPGAYTDMFDVRPASPGYIVSLSDAKLQLNMTTTTDDEELRFYLEAVTAVVEDILGRATIRRSFTEQHTAWGEAMLNWTPVASLTSAVSVDGSTTFNVSDLRVSTSGIVTAKTGAVPLEGDIIFVYTAGDAIVPSNWSLAARIIIQHVWDTQRGTHGAAHAGGTETPGAGFTRYGFLIPNRAKALLTGGLAGV